MASKIGLVDSRKVDWNKLEQNRLEEDWLNDRGRSVKKSCIYIYACRALWDMNRGSGWSKGSSCRRALMSAVRGWDLFRIYH